MKLFKMQVLLTVAVLCAAGTTQAQEEFGDSALGSGFLLGPVEGFFLWKNGVDWCKSLRGAINLRIWVEGFMDCGRMPGRMQKNRWAKFRVCSKVAHLMRLLSPLA